MRISTRHLLAIGAFVPAAVAAQQPATPLTLGDAARLAARQSVPSLAAQLRTREAAARVTQSRSELLPTFNALALQSGHTLNTATFGFKFPAAEGSPPLFDPNGPNAPKGTALPTTPKYKTNWTARYEWPLDQFLAHVQGALTYKSSSWPDLRIEAPNPVFGNLSPSVPIRSALGLQRPFTIVDFTAGVDTDKWNAELFILNAFDERADLYRYAQCTVQTCSANPYIATNRPRTIGVRFGMKFD